MKTKELEATAEKAASEKAVVLPSVDDALEEVNAARAKRGLTPFAPDPKLNEAAKACAKIRATSFIEAHWRMILPICLRSAAATSGECGTGWSHRGAGGRAARMTTIRMRERPG
ncbi:MAG: hypothetical protein U0894_00260 [Pirellulales bacterium]